MHISGTLYEGGLSKMWNKMARFFIISVQKLISKNEKMHETLAKEHPNKPLKLHQSSYTSKMCMGFLNFKFQFLPPYLRSKMS